MCKGFSAIPALLNGMKQITVEQIKQAVAEYDISSWILRRCSLCDSPLSYRFNGDQVGYDSNCACVNYWTPIHTKSFDDVAGTFNNQTDEVRDRLWAEFIASGKKEVAK